MSAALAYGPRAVSRQRRTRVEIEALRAAILGFTSDCPPVSVRQCFYGMVVRGVVEKDETRGYRAVQRQMLRMRRQKALRYDWVSDATRWMRKSPSYRDMGAMLDDTRRFYRRDLWQNQRAYVEVWCEKDALAGVIVEETNEWDVPLMVSRGFSSETYLYEAAEAMKAEEKPCFVYLLTDLDPSGMRIAEHIERKLREFLPDTEVHCERLAVTREQIGSLRLPTRPTKKSGNAHAKGFRGKSVELDAIPPDELRRIVREAIERHIDRRALAQTRLIEKAERATLEQLIEGWAQA